MDRPIIDNSWIKKKYRKYVIITLVAITAIIFMLLGSRNNGMQMAQNKLTIETVSKGLFNDYIQISGQAAPISTVYLDAIEGGRVEELLIEEGSMVKKGTVILRLSNRDLNLSILNSEAQLAEKTNYLRETLLQMEQNKLSLNRELVSAQFDLQYKKRNFEQTKTLFDQNMIAREEMLHSEEMYQLAQQIFIMVKQRKQQDSLFRKLQVEQLNSNLENMQRNLNMVKEQVDFLNVRALVDGQLIGLNVEIGQSVPRGMRLGQINVLTSFKVEADVDEHYIDRVKQGQIGYLDKENDTAKLHIRKVYPDVNNGRFKIDMVFSDSMPQNIRTGQTYYIRLELGSPTNALLVPKGGFFQNTGGQWIFVLDADGKIACKRNIKIGRQNPQYYEILEGLQVNEKVITSSYEIFGENKIINLVKD